MKNRVIGIGGGSGSGKSTLAKKILERLGHQECAILSQDHFYIDQSEHFDEDGGQVNFDHPSAIDFKRLARELSSLKSGEIAKIPQYDFVTHTRDKESVDFPPKKFILLDGTLILHDQKVCELLDASVFVDCPEKLRFDRRLQRDTLERGRNPEGVKKQFESQVKPMHDQYVEACRDRASFVISGESIDAVVEGLYRDLKL